MQYYVIGVGGTGTKCVEAFVHLCAMGVVKGAGRVEIRIVDIDEGGGNYNRLKETLDCYIKFRETVQKIQTDRWFVPELSAGEIFKWSTREDGLGDNDTLDARIGRATMDDDKKLLMRALYGKREREMPLKVGVRGIPRVGSLMCAKSLDFVYQDSFWSELFGEGARAMMMANETRVIVFGSLFGGTGASCTPTIVRQLREWTKSVKLENVKIGMGLMLPYFSFTGEGEAEQEEIRAKADKFIMNSKAAIRYYKEIGVFDYADNLYILGDDMNADRVVKFALGINTKQKNDAMPVEIVAAAAIMDFLYSFEIEPRKLRYVRRLADGDRGDEPYRWSQFPSGNEIRMRMAELLRFAMVFRNYFFRIGATETKREISRIPCFDNFFGLDTFDGTPRTLWVKQYAPVEKYCAYFISWVQQLKRTGMRMIDRKNLLPELEEGSGLPRLKDVENCPYDVTNISDGVGVRDGNIKFINLIKGMTREARSPQQANNYSEFVNKLYGICLNR